MLREIPHPVCAFNSIKVRLKLLLAQAYNERASFQFHKGAIETDDVMPLNVRNATFNSIKVRLKLNITVNHRCINTFNSIKVRLKPPCVLVP